jgi:hypothetical protein
MEGGIYRSQIGLMLIAESLAAERPMACRTLTRVQVQHVSGLEAQSCEAYRHTAFRAEHP